MIRLDGRKVAVSISDGPDRGRLGLPAREVDRALFSICMVLVRAGATIVYSGNLDPEGFTFKMFRHLRGAYAASGDVPFVHIVPEPIIRDTRFDVLLSTIREGSSVAHTLVHLNNKLVPMRTTDSGLRVGEGRNKRKLAGSRDFEDWLDEYPIAGTVAAYSAVRAAATEFADARVVLGGKMGLLDDPADLYEGNMPGVVEEAILTLEAAKPCVPLGAFGGAARDIAIALDLLDAAKAVPRGRQLPSYGPALVRMGTLRTRLPLELRPKLESLADDDRGEPLAYNLADVVHSWLLLS